MKSKKVLRYIVVIVILSVILLIIGKNKGWYGSDFRHKVSVEKGEFRDLIEVITANGKIQPETEVKLSPDVSGEIVEMVIKEGDKVEKGDFLLKIKPDNYISNVRRAEASLNSTRARLMQAQAQLEQARLEYERNKKLWDQKAISEALYEQALTTYNTAKAEKEAAEFSVASAEATLSEAKENLRKTSIYAPMSGTVSMLLVELGERVAGTELMSGTELLRIADLKKMEAEVEVNENDIVKVKHGDTALIEVDAYLGRKFKGVVTEIPVSANTAGATTDQVTNFNVKISLLPFSYEDLVNETNPNPLRPGMSATADIQTNRKNNVLSIPIQTVTTRPDTTDAAFNDITNTDSKGNGMSEGRKEDELIVVFVAKNDTAKMTIVETGIQDDKYIEIKAGIDTSQNVVTAPYSAISKQLKNNDLLEIVEKEDLFKKD